MWQYGRLPTDQARRDNVALDDEWPSALDDQVMRYNHAQRGRQRIRDADESREQVVLGLKPHIGRRQEVVQRGLLLWRRDLLERQPHVVYQQERDTVVARKFMREDRLTRARRATK